MRPKSMDDWDSPDDRIWPPWDEGEDWDDDQVEQWEALYAHAKRAGLSPHDADAWATAQMAPRVERPDPRQLALFPEVAA